MKKYLSLFLILFSINAFAGDSETSVDGGSDIQARKRSVFFIEKPSDPGTPTTNAIRLYAKDKTGTTTLYTKDSAGTVTELGAGGGSGDITSVGDVASGAAFDGTQGTTLTFNNAGGDATIAYDGTKFAVSTTTNITGTLAVSGLVGIGTTTPSPKLHVVAADTNGLWIENTASSSSSAGGGIVAYSNDASAMASGDRLGFYLMGGLDDGGSRKNSSGMISFAKGNWTSTSIPSDLQFQTTASGSTTRTTRLTLDETGLALFPGTVAISSLTSGRIPLVSTSGLLTDSAKLTYTLTGGIFSVLKTTSAGSAVQNYDRFDGSAGGHAGNYFLENGVAKFFAGMSEGANNVYRIDNGSGDPLLVVEDNADTTADFTMYGPLYVSGVTTIGTNSGSTGYLKLQGVTSGEVSLTAAAIAGTGQFTLPSITGNDTLVGKATTDVLTNKTSINGMVPVAPGTNPTTTADGSFSVDTSATSGTMFGFGANSTSYRLPAYLSKSFVVTGVTAAGDFGNVWRVPYAITVRAIHCLAVGGTNVVGQLTECDSNGLNCAVIDSADITCTAATNTNDDGTLSNATLDAGDYLGLATTSVSGTNTNIAWTLEYTVDSVS